MSLFHPCNCGTSPFLLEVPLLQVLFFQRFLCYKSFSLRGYSVTSPFFLVEVLCYKSFSFKSALKCSSMRKTELLVENMS